MHDDRAASRAPRPVSPAAAIGGSRFAVDGAVRPLGALQRRFALDRRAGDLGAMVAFQWLVAASLFALRRPDAVETYAQALRLGLPFLVVAAFTVVWWRRPMVVELYDGGIRVARRTSSYEVGWRDVVAVRLVERQPARPSGASSRCVTIEAADGRRAMFASATLAGFDALVEALRARVDVDDVRLRSNGERC